jgi:hypothetical protein
MRTVVRMLLNTVRKKLKDVFWSDVVGIKILA